MGGLLQHRLGDARAGEERAGAGCTLVSNGGGALQRTVALGAPHLPPPRD